MSRAKHGKTIYYAKFGNELVYTIKESPDYRMWFGSGDGIYIQ